MASCRKPPRFPAQFPAFPWRGKNKGCRNLLSQQPLRCRAERIRTSDLLNPIQEHQQPTHYRNKGLRQTLRTVAPPVAPASQKPPHPSPRKRWWPLCWGCRQPTAPSWWRSACRTRNGARRRERRGRGIEIVAKTDCRPKNSAGEFFGKIGTACERLRQKREGEGVSKSWRRQTVDRLARNSITDSSFGVGGLSIMGRRGPAPTPSEILKIRGLKTANRNRNEPKPTPGRPRCPAWLDAEAKRRWRHACSRVGTIGTAHCNRW